ncbi:MAG TPA: hypothetical protein VGO13_05355 [Solirubrobacterales bacterium]|jgi:hypothetical protein|nr:hypothetical protein [Solirubrobacterales bacterium]
MSILDDAIREHLELKRAHGADEAEVKRLEDEAFGPPRRPDEHDPFAEAPTEFLVAPEVDAGEQPDGEPGERRVPNIADLQEAPEPRQAPQPAEPIADAGPSTEERHAIADQPTEMFDVEAQFEDAATESDAPSDEELVDAELAEPRLAPVDPLAGIEASVGTTADAPADPAPAEDEPADEFDEFFSEQRLSDELNQALEAPLPDEPGASATEEAPAVFIDLDDEEDAPAPVTEVAFEDEELEDEEPSAEYEIAEPEAPAAPEVPAEPEEDTPLPPAASSSQHEDVLEDTPEFLEGAPEDDELWFEQKPPKDFDFDD